MGPGRTPPSTPRVQKKACMVVSRTPKFRRRRRRRCPRVGVFQSPPSAFFYHNLWSQRWKARAGGNERGTGDEVARNTILTYIPFLGSVWAPIMIHEMRSYYDSQRTRILWAAGRGSRVGDREWQPPSFSLATPLDPLCHRPTTGRGEPPIRYSFNGALYDPQTNHGPGGDSLTQIQATCFFHVHTNHFDQCFIQGTFSFILCHWFCCEGGGRKPPKETHDDLSGSEQSDPSTPVPPLPAPPSPLETCAWIWLAFGKALFQSCVSPPPVSFFT